MGYYEDYLEKIKEMEEEGEWNKETAFYACGWIDMLCIKGYLTHEEADKLIERIPITKEELRKVNW
ncbi:MAG: hypothetical protein N3A67_07880 [Ignavibacteria bacterium]|nr:hypothetical protein [Ignavibacteria bacterium]